MENRPSLAYTAATAQDGCRAQTAGRTARVHRHSVHSAIRSARGTVAQGNGMRLGYELSAPRTRWAEGWRLGRVASHPAGVERQPFDGNQRIILVVVCSGHICDGQGYVNRHMPTSRTSTCNAFIAPRFNRELDSSFFNIVIPKTDEDEYQARC